MHNGDCDWACVGYFLTVLPAVQGHHSSTLSQCYQQEAGSEPAPEYVRVFSPVMHVGGYSSGCTLFSVTGVIAVTDVMETNAPFIHYDSELEQIKFTYDSLAL